MPATRALLLAGLAGCAGALHRRESNDPIKKIWKPLPDNPGPKECTRPQDGEKVVYMIVHGEAEQNVDGELTPIGLAQAEDLRDTRMLELALGDDDEYRAQAVIVPPLRRAMQTAVVAFNQTLSGAAWDFNQDIKGPIANNTRRQAGMDTVKLYKPSLANKLKTTYEKMRAEEGVDHFSRFVSYLQGRKERTMIVVATRHEAMLAGANVGEGETAVLALNPPGTKIGANGAGAFHALSRPALWKWCTAVADNTGLSFDDWYDAMFSKDSAHRNEKRQQWEDYLEVAKSQKNDPNAQPRPLY